MRNKEANREYSRRRYRENKEEGRRKSREYKERCKREDPEGWKERVRKADKKFYSKNKEACLSRGKKDYIKRKYGLSLEAINGMLLSQNHKCPICERSLVEGRRAIDHDHSTGEIREILCHRCNCLLGFSEDNIGILDNAILYLEKHREGING